MARKSIRSNAKRSSKRSSRRSRRNSRSISKSRNMRAGAYYSFNSKDVVGGLPAVKRHTDDCPSTSNFGNTLYGAAKKQSGGACGCGKVLSGGRKKRSSGKKSKSKKSRANRTISKRGGGKKSKSKKSSGKKKSKKGKKRSRKC